MNLHVSSVSNSSVLLQGGGEGLSGSEIRWSTLGYPLSGRVDRRRRGGRAMDDSNALGHGGGIGGCDILKFRRFKVNIKVKLRWLSQARTLPRNMGWGERCQERDKSRLPIIIECEPARARARRGGLLTFLDGDPKGRSRGFKTAAEAPRSNLRVRARDGRKQAANQCFWAHGSRCVEDLTVRSREGGRAAERGKGVEWIQTHYRFVCREISPLLTEV